MGIIVDLVGQKFGRLLVLEDTGTKKNRAVVWRCLCDCGNEKFCIGSSLKSGSVSSCGCLQKELLSERVKTHGLAGTPEHTSWKGINNRCRNKNNRFWEDYGGRGIEVCNRWDVSKGGSFENFLEDMGRRPSENHSIDRIDVDGDYCKDNCRWADKSLQGMNKRILPKNTSGRTGVSWSNLVGKWRVKISKNNKVTIVGYFVSFEDAVAARERVELELYGFIKKE